MSKIFKRVAAALMALAMVASMAACVKNNDGNQAQKTDAVTVGNHTLSAVELNYFFVDAVVDWYSANANYAYLLGFDPSKPLSQQVISTTTGETWADSFLNTALDNIRSTYALYNLAMANGFKLSAAEHKQVLNHIRELEETIAYYSKLYAEQGVPGYCLWRRRHHRNLSEVLRDLHHCQYLLHELWRYPGLRQ